MAVRNLFWAFFKHPSVMLSGAKHLWISLPEIGRETNRDSSLRSE